MASGYDGSIRINTKIDDNSFNNKVKGMVNNTKSLSGGMKNVGTSMNGLVGVAKKLGGVLAGVFAIKKIFEFGKQAVNTASDIMEVQNVVDTAFGDMAYKMEEFAKTAIETYGISKLTAKQTGSTYMAMARGMGLAADTASDMAIALTGLSADMASFYNVKQSVADTALKSIFTGETETLKQFGVVMTEANLNAYALSKGMNKTMQQMSQSEKVAIRYQYVMEQLGMVQGDFLKTQDSWANQTRILSERWKELLGILGTGLITVLTPVVKFLNTLVQSLISVSTEVGNLLSKTFGIEVQTTASTGTTAIDTSSYDDATAAIDGATEAQEGLTDATNKTNKAAKDAVAPFDKINVLQQDTTDSATTKLGDTEATTKATEEGTKANSKLSEAMSAVIKKAKELKDIFTAGFFDGLGDYEPRLSKLIGSFDSIKESLRNIFTDGEVLRAFDELLNTLAYSFGQIVGSFASIGLSIATNIVSGIAQYLASSEDVIKQYLINMFNITGEIASLLGEMTSTIAYIFEAFASEEGISVTENLIGIFASAFMGITELALKLVRDLLNIIIQPFVENKEMLREVLTDFFGVIGEILGTIRDAFDSTFAKISEIYDKHLKPFFDSIADGLSKLMSLFLEVWQQYIQPILDNIASKFDDTFKNHIQPLIDTFLELLGTVIDILKLFWEKALIPFFEYIVNTVIPTLAPIFDWVVDAFFEVVNFISDALKGILKIIKGLLEFVVGVFAGEWEMAWNGICDIFIGVGDIIIAVINGILGAVELLVNGIIAGINAMINALNSINIDIPSWVPLIGGNTFGLNIPNLPKVSIPRIPALAEGAVIQPNQEFLAILGDQTSGVNIETPLSTMVDAFKTALNGMNVGGNNGPTTVVLELDGKVAARGLIPYTNAETSRVGVKLVTGGAI